MPPGRGFTVVVGTLSTCTFLGCLLQACKREERKYQAEAPLSGLDKTVRLTNLEPGEPLPNLKVKNEYETNAPALAEGKKLFSNMNCQGCHANGGGGMGPPLMDEKWLYGSEPDQIYATILQGRPNGMPSFAGKLTVDQTWKLVAYVRSLSGQVNQNAATGRDDSMQIKKPENSTKKQEPKDAGNPSRSGEKPQ